MEYNPDDCDVCKRPRGAKNLNIALLAHSGHAVPVQVCRDNDTCLNRLIAAGWDTPTAAELDVSRREIVSQPDSEVKEWSLRLFDTLAVHIAPR